MDRDNVGGSGWFTENAKELEAFGPLLQELLRFLASVEMSFLPVYNRCLCVVSGGQWATAEFEAGDCVIFGLHTFHGSSVNTTSKWRVSADVRFQPVDEPADPRWCIFLVAYATLISIQLC